MDKRIERVITALQKNNVEGIYIPSINDIVKTVEDMLFPNCVITAGGSTSIKESGVWDLINRDCYNFYDRTREGITPEEQQEIFKTVIGSDFYFCSTNALTEKGELINVDGDCGGYNLQWAWSSGRLAGKTIGERINNAQNK